MLPRCDPPRIPCEFSHGTVGTGVGGQTVMDGVALNAASRAVDSHLAKRSIAALVIMILVVGLSSSLRGSEAVAGSSSNFYLLAGSGGAPNPPGSTGISSSLVGFASPSGVASDASGNLLVADTSNGEVDLVVRAPAARYMLSGVSSPVVGDTYVLAGGGTSTPSTGGAPATSVGPLLPNAVVTDSSGNVLLAESHQNEIDVVAESATNPGYVITGTWTAGNIYVIAGGGTLPPTVGGGSATAAALNQPRGVAIDSAGDVIIADTSDNEIDLLALTGAGTGGSRTAGDLYVIAGGGTAGPPTSSGTVATSVQFNQPSGVAVDASGNIAIADSSHNAVDILALSSSDPGYGIGASWVIGRVYRILGGGANVPTTGGVTSEQAELNAPEGIAFDASGDLVVADVNNFVLEVLALEPSNPGYALGTSTTWTEGDIYLVAGGGLSNVSSTGTVANQSHLYAPIGVAPLPDGSLALIDHSSKLLDRLILAPSMPRTLGATAQDSAVALSWSPPSDNGGSVVSDYVVYVYDHGQTLPIATDDLGSTATSLTVSGLSNGVTYDFSVAAVNAIGESATSAVVSGTPLAPPPPVSTTTTSIATTTTSTATAITSTATPTASTATATAAVTPTASPTSSSSSVPPATSVGVSSRVDTIATASVHARVSMVGAPFDTSSRGISFTIRCSTGICIGSLTLTYRHPVILRGRNGSIPVYEEAVVARVFYRDASLGTRVIRVPLTSYGRGMIRSLSSKGAPVVATATVRGGAMTKRRFRLFPYRSRVQRMGSARLKSVKKV